MIEFFNTLPNWMLAALAILTILFFLIAALYYWILTNWLETRRQMARLQARLGPLEAEHIALQHQLEQAQTPAQDTTALQTALGEFQSKAAYANRAVELKQAALDAAMQHISRFEQREADFGNLTAQVDAFKVDLAHAGKRLSERDSTIANLTQQLATMKSATDSTSSMVATQEKQLADCYRQLSEAKSQLSLYAGRGSSQTLDTSIEDLRLQLDDTRAKLKQTNEHIAEQLQAIENLNGELAQAKAEHEHALAEAFAFETQIATLNDQIAQARRAADPSTRQARLAELAAEIRAAMGKMEQAKTEAGLHEKRAEESQTQIGAAEAQLAASRQEAAQYEMQVSALDNQLSTAQAETHNVQAELEAAQKAIEAREATIQSREALIAELNAQLGNTRTSLEMAHEAIQARDLALANANQQASTLLAAPVLTDEAAGEFEAAKTLLAARDAQVSELEEWVADLEKDLGDHKFAWESVNVAMAERLTAVSELNMELDSMEAQLQEAVAKVDAQNATIAELTDEAKAASETFSLQQSSHDNAVSNFSAQLQEMNARATMRAAEMAELEKRFEEAQSTLNAANARAATHAEGIGELMKQLEVARAELDLARAAPPITQNSPPAQFVKLPKTRKVKAPKTNDVPEDNLTDIVGIGAVYAKRLRKEGIGTFKALAKLKPAQLQKIINPAKWQTLDFESWIEQAREKAKK